MAFVIADRVRETTATTGTGTVSLDGAISGFRSFVSAIGSGNNTYYAISDGNAWEVGIGTVTSGTPNTLSRDTVLSNSLGNTSKVTFAAGSKDVAVVLPASKAIIPENAAAGRTALGLGDAATRTVGTGASNLLQTSDADSRYAMVNQAATLLSLTLTSGGTAPTISTPGTSDTQLATTAFVHSVVNGFLSITGLTGGTRVLTADEAANAVISLAGTLTSNLVIEIPTTSNRLYSISNTTTGAFSVSVRAGSAGTTVAVAQGKRNLVFTNTAGAYDAINDFDAIALTGVSTAPTAAVDTNTTQIATTAFVVGQASSSTPANNGTAAVGTSLRYARADHVHATDTTRAPLASPAFTGAPSAPTAATTTNTTQIATTAYVKNNLANYLPLTGGAVSGGINCTGTAGAIGQSGEIGGSFAAWNVDRYYAIQVECANNTSAYGLARWTKTGERHLAAIDCFAGGSGVTAPRMDIHVGSTTNAFSFSQGGNFTAQGSVTEFSDMRLKTDIELIPNAMAKVEQLRGVTYIRLDTGERQTGVIAQEVQAVLPEAVRVFHNEEQTLSVAYGSMVGLLVEAVKELSARIAMLEGAA